MKVYRKIKKVRNQLNLCYFKEKDCDWKPMNRRDFFKAITTALFIGRLVPQAFASTVKGRDKGPSERLDNAIKDYLHKMQRFDQSHSDDVYIESGQIPLLKSSVARFNRLQSLVGHGNFHILSFLIKPLSH